MADSPSGKLAILVGGGPAPGINGVISSVTIEAINQGLEVLGVPDGFSALVAGNTDHVRPLGTRDVVQFYPRGGSMLGTSRTNPAKDPDHMRNVIDSFRRLGVSYLVTIGGDDTAFSGSRVHKSAGGAIKVAHVPKTIDNDLPLPAGIPTFGFETARHIGAQLARNLHEDAKTTGRWYLIVSMGRAAGHLALGIGKASASALTLISEEFRGGPASLSLICDCVIGAMIKRKARGRKYGLAIMAEGLIEAIGEANLVTELGQSRLRQDRIDVTDGHVTVTYKWLAENVHDADLTASAVRGRTGDVVRLDATEVVRILGEDELRRYGSLERDPFGHLRLGEIEFGRIIRHQIGWRLAEIGLKVAMIDKDLGYELRCADPIPFDAEYTRNLGFGAVKFLLSPAADQYGAIISFVGGRMQPLRFEDMIDPATSKMRPRLVDVDSENYECARRYMIRLESEDFDKPEKLRALADVVKMTPEQFKARFEYVVR